MITDYLYILMISSIASSIGGLLGIGGGVLMVPLFVILLKIQIQQAVAISLFTIIGLSMLVSSKHIKSGALNLPLGFTLELSTTLGAIIGSIAALNINHKTLSLLFALFLMVIAVMTLKDKKAAQNIDTEGEYSYFDHQLNRKVFYTIKNLPIAYLVSFIAGVSSGMFGIGGGILKVPILANVCKLPMKVASATSSFMVGITASASAFIYFKHGRLNPFFAFVSLLGAYLGAKVGVYLHSRLRNDDIRRVFFVVLLIIAIEMFLRSLR
ncbi:sulfite exporter TauE/SafE family protein [Hippea sp. KM1]|uniref:sulfite exporter TauE/SafE family protein n=1 Tax=Hippea sp. KM1 TaxID=944481 RepID=UPI00046D1CAE|nr:sulfite exporter TauE/SafE family protein [Hippea sp. KM1]